MLTTLKTRSVTKWTWSGAGYVRKSLGEKQNTAPNRTLLFLRARYYDTSTGEFISRDPLEYVDGMSLYRGYFVPTNVDFTGMYTHVVSDSLPPAGIWNLAALASLVAPAGRPTKADGILALSKLTAAMTAKCDACCKKCDPKKCEFDPKGPSDCCAGYCKANAAKIAKHILETWKFNYGKGSNTSNDAIGGYLCWDWSKGFSGAASKASKCWGVEEQRRFKLPPKKVNGKLRYVVHYYIVLSACGNKADKCKVVVDDGWYKAKKFVHAYPFLPDPPWKDYGFKPPSTGYTKPPIVSK